MKTVIIWLAMVYLITITATLQAAVLESPNQGVNLSGIGFISGWKCSATDITITINDGEHLVVAMHQERADLIGVCGSTRHGFIKQVNWAWPIISDGKHVIVAYDEGVEFDRVEFTVGTLGEEFVTGLERRTVIEGFPSPNEYTVMEWNQSTQHFEAFSVMGGESENDYDPVFWAEFDNPRNLFGEPWEEELLYAEVPNVDNCEAGSLSELAKNRALEAANQIRGLHGLSPLKYSTLYDNQMQQASLILQANKFLTHVPPSAKCYTEEGAEGVQTSNLSIISANIKNLDPADHIILLANDYYDIALPGSASRRRWILNPFATYFSYGQAGIYFATQKIKGFLKEPTRTPQINVDFVAFPYETYPYNLLNEDPPWSFSVIIDKRNLSNNQGDFFKNARVTVTDVSDEVTLPISNQYTDTHGFGLPNFLSWKVEAWEHNTLYKVDIKNVKLKSGTTRNYSYLVFIKQQSLDN